MSGGGRGGRIDSSRGRIRSRGSVVRGVIYQGARNFRSNTVNSSFTAINLTANSATDEYISRLRSNSELMQLIELGKNNEFPKVFIN